MGENLGKSTYDASPSLKSEKLIAFEIPVERNTAERRKTNSASMVRSCLSRVTDLLWLRLLINTARSYGRPRSLSTKFRCTFGSATRALGWRFGQPCWIQHHFFPLSSLLLDFTYHPWRVYIQRKKMSRYFLGDFLRCSFLVTFFAVFL
jgi:hypothetical protein